jgi:hypothetical protein
MVATASSCNELPNKEAKRQEAAFAGTYTMVALNTHPKETREPGAFDYDRVVWDPAYRREVIERLKRDDAGNRAEAAPQYS